MNLHDPSADTKLITRLYPYHSVDIFTVFVYGSNYQRQSTDNVFSKLKVFLFNWTNLFVIMAAVVLCFVRRLGKLRRDGFISVLIDVTVIFIGGGRLRMDHKLERWFFVIVSTGALFLNGICLEPTLFPSFLLPQQSVDTLQQLTEIRPPIYSVALFKRDEHLVIEMLRSVNSFVFSTFLANV